MIEATLNRVSALPLILCELSTPSSALTSKALFSATQGTSVTELALGSNLLLSKTKKFQAILLVKLG